MTSPAVKLMMAAAAPSFLPTDLPNLFAWFDASDTATITETGGAVSTWADKSGNGNDATAASSNPTTGTRTINSLNVLDFDGTDDRMTFPATTSTSFTIYVVLEADVLPTAGNVKRILSTYDGAGALVGGEFIIDIADSTGDKPRVVYAGGSNVMSTTVSTATPYVITARFGNGVDPVTAFVQWNNSSGFSGGGTTGATAAIRSWSIGEDNVAGGTEFWDGKIGEIIVYDGSAHDATTRTTVKNYLYDKWGITP